MRILEIIDVYWWNACGYYAVELARGLEARGHDVVVAGGPDALPIERARRHGLEVWTDFGFESAWAAKDFWRWSGELQRRAFDVIDAHRGGEHLWSALARRWRGGPPVVRTRGDVRPPRSDVFNRRLNRAWTAEHIVPSRFMHDAVIKELAVAPERVSIVPAGIDLDAFQIDDEARLAGAELRRRLEVGSDAALLAIVARLSPIKGHRVALEAVARVPGTPHLVLVGQEEEVSAASIMEAARSHGIADRVHILGRSLDVRPILAAADLLLVPSLGSEAICRVLLEGMAMSLPAVASRVGVIGEVVEHQRTGWLLEPGQVEPWAATLAELVGDWPAARERLRHAGQEARRRVEAEYGLELWMKRAETVYRRVIAGGRAS